MHVLWISDSPGTPSGFGMVTRYVCAGLAARGHRVSIIGWQTREPGQFEGCSVLPVGADPMGSDAIFPFLVRHRPDVVVALADVWWLPFFAAPHLRRQLELTGTPWLLYFPIDGDTGESGSGGLPASWVALLREVDQPVAMSRYGQQVARDCGIDCDYIPHGVDLDLFRPPADRAAAKAAVGAAGRFVVLSDSRNQPRKMLPRLLDAFAHFAAGRSDTLLHLHTDPQDPIASSPYYRYDVRADVAALGLAEQVRFTPGFGMRRGGGLSRQELARYYQAADVHLLASSGEGFGLPTLQAAAAGAVPLACDYSASRELVLGHGETLPVADYCRTEFGIRRALIDVEATAATLERLYQDRTLLASRSAAAARFAAGYGWPKIVDEWDALLRRLAGRRGNPGGTPGRFADRSSQSFVEARLVETPGATVIVRRFERTFGRLEAFIHADIGRQYSDVRLPTIPAPWQSDQLRVRRQPGRIGLTEPGRPVSAALRRIFPGLSEWLPAAAGRDDCRLGLAQSVLLLDLDGSLPDWLLVEAAALGVACVGAPSRAQVELWPELVVVNPDAACRLARALLTDPAAMRRQVSAAARAVGSTAPDPAALAESISAAHRALTAMAEASQ
jgi:glycosyltransferase involved in cell wall biosynthesis